MTLVASACPRPLTPTLTPPEMAAASDAAIDVAWIVAFSALVNEMSPVAVVTPVAAWAI